MSLIIQVVEIFCNLLIKEEGLGEEGVPNMRLLKKTGKPIKTPYRFLND